MSKNKTAITVVSWMILFSVFIIPGCVKDTTVIIPLDSVITRTVSFKNDIIPIFSNSCSLSGCHATGGHVPDLSNDKAYTSLINGKYVDKDKPETSIIYGRLTGKISPSMPLGGTSNPSNINALMLAWIKQGAKDN